MDASNCPDHLSLLTTQVELHAQMQEATRRFESLDDKVDAIAKDIRSIKDALTGDLMGSANGIQQRLAALEGTIRSFKKLAWAIGVPLLVATLFVIGNAIYLVWEHVI